MIQHGAGLSRLTTQGTKKMIEPKFYLELTEDQATDLGLALHRAFHLLDKMAAEYTKLTEKDAGFRHTLAKYVAEREAVRALITLSRERWEALQDEKQA